MFKVTLFFYHKSLCLLYFLKVIRKEAKFSANVFIMFEDLILNKQRNFGRKKRMYL